MSILFRDLKLAIRHLRRSPGFACTAILMLAFGIGVTTAIFSIVESVLLRPLPFPAPDRLVALSEIRLDHLNHDNNRPVTAQDILAYRQGLRSFESLGGYKQASFELSGAGKPENVNVTRLGAGIFPALGVAPLLGRTFTQQEDDTRQPVAVLSYALWQRRFHGDAHVLGGKILLDRNPYVILGIMPRGFEFPLLPGHLSNSGLWVPLSLAPGDLALGSEADFSFQIAGRLKAGVTPAQAQEDAQHIAEQTMSSYPAFMKSVRIRPVIRSLKDEAIAPARPLVCTLFLAAVVVLLIACTNLAGLLLVRAIHRRHEIAVCLALGASGTALVRQAALESLVLTLTGGLLGLPLASIALNVGVQRLPETLPRIDEIALDWRGIAFTIALATLTGLLCGIAPAFAALRTHVSSVLKDGGRTGTRGARHVRLRSALVVAEIAITFVLVVSAGLLLRSFEKMRAVDLGFRPDHAVAAAYSLPREQYPTQDSVNVFNEELLRRLQQMPGVRSVGLSTGLPQATPRDSVVYQVEGHVSPRAYDRYAINPVIAGNYFQAMGIPLLRGRLFTPADDAGSQLVVIVNHKVAEFYWPGQSPIGKRIRWGLPETPMPWMTIVGEVADVKQESPDQDARDQVYEPLHQANIAYGSFSSFLGPAGGTGYIVLRSALRPEEVENQLRDTVHSIDRQLPLSQIRTMQQAVSAVEAPRRFNTTLISAFAVSAALLAALGIYGVMAFSTALRTQEIAIRLALGSPPATVLRLVLVSAARLAAAGCAFGLIGAIAASRLLRSFLFGVSPFDPLVMALSATGILLLALAASLVPARRAASIDPVEALRSE